MVNYFGDEKLCIEAYNLQYTSKKAEVKPRFWGISIHPFADGNGRTGRLWQTALLASRKQIFEWIPIGSIIKDNQKEYYRAIGLLTAKGKSDRFILFMLEVIKKAVSELARDTRSHQSHISNQISALISS